jgi:hypothetical protein
MPSFPLRSKINLNNVNVFDTEKCKITCEGHMNSCYFNLIASTNHRKFPVICTMFPALPTSIVKISHANAVLSVVNTHFHSRNFPYNVLKPVTSDVNIAKAGIIL